MKQGFGPLNKNPSKTMLHLWIRKNPSVGGFQSDAPRHSMERIVLVGFATFSYLLITGGGQFDPRL